VEIITIVLDGKVTHEDNMGNREVLEVGEVQSISTGTGIEHSEFNREKGLLHFYQILIQPCRDHLEPIYSKKKFELSSWKNRLFPLVSGQGFEDALQMIADATVYRSTLERGHILHFNPEEKRLVFIYLSAGELLVNCQRFGQGDQARIDLERILNLQTDSSAVPAEFILIDVLPASNE
jgi:quercetin 2,3-dioxygenase